MELWDIEALADRKKGRSVRLGSATRQTIAELIQRHFSPSGELLHLAAAPGAAAVALAQRFRGWQWRPMVHDEADLASLAAWRGAAAVVNLRKARTVSFDEAVFPITGRVDAVLWGPVAAARLRRGLQWTHRTLRPGGLCLVVLDAAQQDGASIGWTGWSMIDSADPDDATRVVLLERTTG